MTRRATGSPMARAALVLLAAVWLGGCGINNIPAYDEAVKAQWAQVQNQYQRRADLVPNLVETVKGYAGHEQTTLEAVVEARNAAVAAGSVGDQTNAENMLTGALRQLFALAESYPDLKASDNFRTLQTQLADIEGDITVARQIYNDTTLTYNNAVETIPTNLVAAITGFERGIFFEVEDEGRSVPKVQF